jgi:hypothetical protein
MGFSYLNKNIDILGKEEERRIITAISLFSHPHNKILRRLQLQKKRMFC